MWPWSLIVLTCWLQTGPSNHGLVSYIQNVLEAPELSVFLVFGIEPCSFSGHSLKSIKSYYTVICSVVGITP